MKKGIRISMSGFILWLWLLPLSVATICCNGFLPSQEFFFHTKKRGTHCKVWGMKINIRIVGRQKSGSDQWIEGASSMYETRLKPSNVEVETTWHKDNPALIKGVESDKKKGHTVVLLDPLGTTKTSERFSEDMYEWLDRGGSRLSFVIGGADGLPNELRYPQQQQGQMLQKISLSALTFTHQFARILLIEQIYRATEIRKGSGYHK